MTRAYMSGWRSLFLHRRVWIPRWRWQAIARRWTGGGRRWAWDHRSGGGGGSNRRRSGCVRMGKSLSRIGPWRSLASALAWGARGPGFKSRRPDQLTQNRHSLPENGHCPGLYTDLMWTRLGACAPILAAVLLGQELHISGQRIRAHIQYLASDELEGRGVGTRGEQLATDYLASQLRAEGVKPAGDGGTYFQAVPMIGATTLPSS